MIDDPVHKEALLAERRRAVRTEGKTTLTRSVPESERFLDAAFHAGESHTRASRSLETLLRLWGARALQESLVEVMRRAIPTLASVNVLLEQQRRRNRRPAVRPLDLGDRPELEALHVQPHSLEDYDGLTHEDNH